jgi:flagellar hook-associated protein 2
MSEDPQGVQDFFTGTSTVDQYDNVHTEGGVFDKLNDTLKSYLGTNGNITILGDGLRTEHKSLESNYDRSLALLNARYDTMTQQFIEYDSIISKLNNQFSSLQQQIEMAVNGK